MDPIALGVGLLAGVLSGMFGVGGGVLTTPAIRALGHPALIAVGTPLPVIIPTAVTGFVAYLRKDLVDVRGGLIIGGCGSAAAVAGAFGSALAGGRAVLTATALLVFYIAYDMVRRALRRGPETAEAGAGAPSHRRAWRLAVLGIAAGVYSGFLGLGGGFVIVPALARLFRYPVKRAIGTSLLAISIMAVPGSAAHWALGHVDAGLALALVAGVIPGSLIGARLTHAASDRWVEIGFATLLLLSGVWLVLSEWGVA